MSFKIEDTTNSISIISNPQIQDLINPPIITTPPIEVDPDLEPFITFSNDYFNLISDELGCPSIHKGIPLINLLQDQIPISLNRCCYVDHEFPNRVLRTDSYDEKQYKSSDLLEKFLTCILHFKSGQNKKEIVDFLTKCMEKMAEASEEKKNDFSSKNILDPILFVDMFLPYTNLFLTGRIDLLSKELCYFITKDQELSNPEKFRVAVKSYQLLCRCIETYGVISLNKFLIYFKSFETKVNFNEKIKLAEISQLNLEVLQKNNILKRENKCSIISLFKRLSNELHDENTQFVQKFTELFSLDIDDNYLPIIQSDSVDKICQTKINYRKNKNGFSDDVKDDSFDQNYVQKNRTIYEQFLPRIVEATQWVTDKNKRLSKIAFILREFHFFIKFGNLESLNQKLSNLKEHSFKNVEEVLFEEIQLFTENKLKDFGLIKNISETISSKGLRSIYSLLQDVESFHKTSIHIVSALFDGPIEFARNCQRDLYIFTPKIENTLPPQSNQTSSKGKKPTLTISSSQTTSSKPSKSTSSNQIKTTLPISPSPRTPPKPSNQITLPQQSIDKTAMDTDPLLCHLQNTQNNAADSFFELSKGWKMGSGVDKAIGNAQNQLQDLLHAMLRLMEMSNKPLSKSQVHACVIDLISHATLMSEQMLFALNLASNESNAEKTHNLYNILLRCKFKAGPLSTDLRNWVREANGGEILVRNLDECTLGVSSLQNLLVKTKCLIEGSDAFSAQDILLDAIAFCKNAGELTYALQIQINAAKNKPSNNTSNADDFIIEFSSFCKELSKKVTNEIKMDATPSQNNPSDTSVLRNSIEVLSQLSGVCGLNNVLNNLLVHLETEMASHSNLQPIYAHLHCSQVLLLNQMIGEAVLLKLIDHCFLFYYGDDHDLFAMATLLGMTEKHFTSQELEFLKKGRAVRQIVRYPENFDIPTNKNGIFSLKTTVLDAMDLAKGQKINETYRSDEGFKISSNANTNKKLKNIKSYVATDVAILSSILLKIIKNINK